MRRVEQQFFRSAFLRFCGSRWNDDQLGFYRLGLFLAFFTLATSGALATWIGTFFGFARLTSFTWLPCFTWLSRLAWFTLWLRLTLRGFLWLACFDSRRNYFFFRLVTTATTIAATAARVASGAFAALALCWLDRNGRHDGCGWLFAKQTEQLRQETFRCNLGDQWRDRQTAVNDRRWLVRRDALDHSFLTRLGIVFLALVVADVSLCLLSQRIAGLHVFETWIVMLQTFEFVMRCFQMLVRNQDDVDTMTRLDFQDFATLFIQHEGSHINRRLYVNRSGVFLHRFFLNNPQYLQTGRFGVADMTSAVAARAGYVTAFGQ